MKKTLIIILISLLCISNTCKEEGENCHFKIAVVNKSSQNIMFGWNIRNTSNKCYVSVSVIKPDETYEYTENNCWESALSNGKTTDFYLIDPNNYNAPSIFYDCDSLEIKNTVLKHYLLTLPELKRMNFKVIYP